MKQQDYTAIIAVNANASDAYDCINRVSAWWTENLEGSSEKMGDVFTVTFGETFVTFEVNEAVPAQKVEWLVTSCYLHWLNDKEDWLGTKVRFELTPQGGGTQIVFTHIGLVPKVECYNNCVKGWDQYIKSSLFALINTGNGMPTRRKLAAAV